MSGARQVQRLALPRDVRRNLRACSWALASPPHPTCKGPSWVSLSEVPSGFLSVALGTSCTAFVPT